MAEQTNTVKLNSEDPVDTTIKAWIQNEATPIDTNLSSGFNAAVDKLVMSLDDAITYLLTKYPTGH